jgi:hypothetical protein
MGANTTLLTSSQWAKNFAALVLLTGVIAVRSAEAEGCWHRFHSPWQGAPHAGVDLRVHSALFTYPVGVARPTGSPSADPDWVRMPAAGFRDPGTRL